MIIEESERENKKGKSHTRTRNLAMCNTTKVERSLKQSVVLRREVSGYHSTRAKNSLLTCVPCRVGKTVLIEFMVVFVKAASDSRSETSSL